MLAHRFRQAAAWLAAEVCEKERQVDPVRAELVAQLREERIEPPARDRIRRIIGTALRQAEQTQTSRISSWIPAAAIPRLLALVAKSADPGDEPEDQVEDAPAPLRPSRHDLLIARREELSRIVVERVVVRDRSLASIEWVPAVRPFFEKRQRECPQGDSNP